MHFFCFPNLSSLDSLPSQCLFLLFETITTQSKAGWFSFNKLLKESILLSKYGAGYTLAIVYLVIQYGKETPDKFENESDCRREHERGTIKDKGIEGGHIRKQSPSLKLETPARIDENIKNKITRNKQNANQSYSFRSDGRSLEGRGRYGPGLRTNTLWKTRKVSR